jgi:hypothetical protein
VLGLDDLAVAGAGVVSFVAEHDSFGLRFIAGIVPIDMAVLLQRKRRR